MSYYDNVKSNTLAFYCHTLAGGFSFEHKNGSLLISPANAIDEEMANLIRFHKAELIEILKEQS
jgi:hypothetical protein